MKVICRNSNEVYIFSPQEVIEVRQKFRSQESFKHLVLSGDILQKIINIATIHGFTYYDYALEACYTITSDLSIQYSFQYGCQYRIVSSRIPEFLRKDIQGTYRFLEYTRMILEAFGWIITFSEDDNWYYFNFSPLLALTPEEVDSVIKDRTDKLAAQAIQTINKGLINHKNSFSYQELNLTDIHRQDVILTVNTIIRLMGIKWIITTSKDLTLQITPSTP